MFPTGELCRGTGENFVEIKGATWLFFRYANVVVRMEHLVLCLEDVTDIQVYIRSSVEDRF